MTEDEKILKELKEDLETIFPQTTLGLLERYFETKFGGDTPEPIEKEYKEIIGYLSQSGESAPQLRIIKNDFDEIPFFGRLQIGIYVMAFPTIKFDVNKVLFQNPTSRMSDAGASNAFLKTLIFKIDDSDEDSLYFQNQPESIVNPGPEDGITIPWPFNLRIYN